MKKFKIKTIDDLVYAIEVLRYRYRNLEINFAIKLKKDLEKEDTK